MLNVTAVRAFTDNYIWLFHAPCDASQVLAVDPGDAAPVNQALSQRRLSLSGILITHHHPDHVGGVADLLRERQVPGFGPAGESVPGTPRPLREGNIVELPSLGLTFSVLDVPGHTAGHIAYVGHGAVFCGDTLFSAGCGRLLEGTAEQMAGSLAKLARACRNTGLLCARVHTQQPALRPGRGAGQCCIGAVSGGLPG